MVEYLESVERSLEMNNKQIIQQLCFGTLDPKVQLLFYWLDTKIESIIYMW